MFVYLFVVYLGGGCGSTLPLLNPPVALTCERVRGVDERTFSLSSRFLKAPFAPVVYLFWGGAAHGSASTLAQNVSLSVSFQHR